MKWRSTDSFGGTREGSQVTTPERVSPEEQRELSRIASAVEADLCLAGLPVIHGGCGRRGRTDGAPGALVSYDPGRDGSPGVHVRWCPSAELTRMTLAADGPGHRIAEFGGSVLDTMTNALGEVLRAAGWHVDATGADVHGASSVRVLEGTRTAGEPAP